VKLYGDLDQYTTIVLARQDYETFFRDREELITLLRSQLSSKTMLYLGWSHTDPHFNLILGELRDKLDYLRTGYAVMFNVPEATRDDLQNRRKITIVDLPQGDSPTDQITKWLTELSSDNSISKKG
jgi:hypothetical protein